MDTLMSSLEEWTNLGWVIVLPTYTHEYIMENTYYPAQLVIFCYPSYTFQNCLNLFFLVYILGLALNSKGG
jgi:hypothetical protein